MLLAYIDLSLYGDMNRDMNRDVLACQELHRDMNEVEGSHVMQMADLLRIRRLCTLRLNTTNGRRHPNLIFQILYNGGVPRHVAEEFCTIDKSY